MTENTSRRVSGRQRPRGYADWQPNHKTRALLEQIAYVLDEYQDHLPLTVRQIFYRLVAEHGHEKTEPAYRKLSDKLVRARRAKIIPFEFIRDDGVTTYPTQWHDGPEHFWDDTIGRVDDYRRDRQAGQHYQIELWCESAGMLPQLARVAHEFSVPVFSAGGFASVSATRMISERACAQVKPTLLLHVGDYDPSGVSIFTSLTEDAAEFVTADRIIENLALHAERVALTADQVADYGLETAPPKTSDSRSAGWVGETCQLEALAPNDLAQIVTEAIAAHVDPFLLRRQIEREQLDQAELRRHLPRGSS